LRERYPPYCFHAVRLSDLRFQGTVSLAGKFPAASDYSRAAASGGRVPDFQCTAPITIPDSRLPTRWFSSPTARRDQRPNDLEFHLPSYNIEMNASIVVTAGRSRRFGRRGSARSGSSSAETTT